jgi:hypothetical protein
VQPFVAEILIAMAPHINPFAVLVAAVSMLDVAAIGIIYLFEGGTLKLFFINAGYFVVAFPLMGLVLGAWR